MQLNFLNGIFDADATATITLSSFILCVAVSLLVGLFLALTYSYKSRSSKSFVVTLATLPVVVCVVILIVNGNIGTGVAVAGTFSLVRFRSIPGTAKEIGAIFVAMGAGLMLGMGYLCYAVLFTVIVSLVNLLYNQSSFGEKKNDLEKTVTITIPEDLNYTEVFDDLMEKYTTSYSIVKVKTTNMGSLFKITYNVTLKTGENEKSFIDELRVRNGNLEICISPQQIMGTEL
ncbi:MAG: DUF4956 domain-containing protein [Clostridiales bacterium]|nr:DUF4956 domain-containing protein [Clostridiales bacterium]